VIADWLIICEYKIHFITAWFSFLAVWIKCYLELICHAGLATCHGMWRSPSGKESVCEVGCSVLLMLYAGVTRSSTDIWTSVCLMNDGAKDLKENGVISRTRGSHSSGYRSTTFKDVTQCILLKINQCFTRIYCLHLQGRISRACHQHESWYLTKLIRTMRWKRYVSRKRQLTFNTLHGVISQKTLFSVFAQFHVFSSSVQRRT
jgi:hypothetical protein